MELHEETVTLGGSSAGVDGGARRLAPPPRTRVLAVSAIAFVVVVVAVVWVLPMRQAARLQEDVGDPVVWQLATGLLALGVTALLIPAVLSLRLSNRARALELRGEIVQARHTAAQARERAHRALGFGAFALVVLSVEMFILANDAAIVRTFFSWEQIERSWVEILKAAKLNLWIAVVAEVLVLTISLTLAIIRLSPGRSMAPLRWLAICYIDTFRAIPLIILLYLVAFGIPIAGIPVVSDLPTEWLIVLGLTITTSAYVAEVFRSAIESIHWSQTAAARSLGFSTAQTWRHVVVPQAVRRVLPPLLSYFVGLQKDTALVLVVGAIDAFGQAKIYAGNYFNLSSVTFVAILFVAITIPQTRFVDYLVARQARREGAQVG